MPKSVLLWNTLFHEVFFNFSSTEYYNILQNGYKGVLKAIKIKKKKNDAESDLHWYMYTYRVIKWTWNKV